MENEKKIIVAMVAVIAVLLIVAGYFALTPHQDDGKPMANNTTLKNKTVKNATLVEKTTTSSSESGQYGYCAICGKALSASEANNEFTQGKVCTSCAKNPYYQTGEGAEYANQKLFEAYPEEYGWMYDDTPTVEHTYDYYPDDGGDSGDNYY